MDPRSRYCVRLSLVCPAMGSYTPPPMNGIVASVSAFPHKLTIFHTNSVCAVAGTIIPFMRGGCSKLHRGN